MPQSLSEGPDLSRDVSGDVVGKDLVTLIAHPLTKARALCAHSAHTALSCR